MVAGTRPGGATGCAGAGPRRCSPIPGPTAPAPSSARDIDETAASLDAFIPATGTGGASCTAWWDRDRRRLRRRPAVALPAGAGGRPAGGPPPTCRSVAPGPARRSCPSAGWPTSTSPAKGAGSSWPAAPSTPTSPPRWRPAACSAGCSPAWARSSATRCPKAAPASLTDALVRRLEAKGGRLRCATEVEAGRSYGAAEAVGRPYGGRSRDPGPAGRPGRRRGSGPVPGPHRRGAPPAQAAPPTWTASSTTTPRSRSTGPSPARSRGSTKEARRAGTVHTGDDLDHLTRPRTELTMGRIPARPLPAHRPDDDHRPDPLAGGHRDGLGLRPRPREVAVRRRRRRPHRALGRRRGRASSPAGWRREIEQLAPGFSDLVRGRHVFGPPDLEAANANLVRGAVNGGTAQLHQQLVFRPDTRARPGRDPLRRPVPRLRLGPSRRRRARSLRRQRRQGRPGPGGPAADLGRRPHRPLTSPLPPARRSPNRRSAWVWFTRDGVGWGQVTRRRGRRGPRVWRRPDRTVLTPWRIGPADQPRAVRTGRSRVVNTSAVALGDQRGRGPGLGPGPLLDDDELAAGVVDTGLVEADDDLEGEHEVAVEVAVQGVPVARPVAQDERRGAGLAGGVALVEPVLERRRATGRAGPGARPTPGRWAGGGARRRPAARPRRRAGDGRSSGTGPAPKRWRAMSMVDRNRSSSS